MTSIGRILTVARSALQANQAAISVTAQNVANANTEGYSRQRANLSTAEGVRLPEGTYGSGVNVDGVSRVRDSLLDGTFRAEFSRSEGFGARADLLRRVESLMGEPGEAGLSSALDRFWSAWSELATSPESEAARSTLRQEAEALVFRMNDLAGAVDRLRLEGVERLQQNVDRAQTLLGDLVEMNRSIVVAESAGREAPDLRDQRDRALDELAGLLPITVRENGDGSVRVNLGGIGIVDGSRVQTLTLDSSGSGFTVVAAGRPVTLESGDGRLGGLLQTVNGDLPALRGGLDEVAQALVTSVNTLHAQGTNLLGQEGVLFFDQPTDGDGNLLPVTASGIRLSEAVRGSALAIAAGTGSDPGEPGNEVRPGVNDIALALAGLRDGQAVGLDGSVSARYGQLVGELANATRQSRDSAQVHRILSEQANFRRGEESGVSIDEEMVKLIQFQAAYGAAARVLSAADEMLETLLRI